MHPIRRTAIALAILLQLVSLGFICVQREMVWRNGAVVYLRTAPVDPRDIWRGDYVRLNYEISRLPGSLATGAAEKDFQTPEKRVYLSYHTDPRQVLVPRALSLEKPEPPFIRGYTTIGGAWQRVAVRYGLEKYFVQQGQGLVLENAASRHGVPIPLEMAVAVDRTSGMAVIKGHRLGEMGLGVSLARIDRENLSGPLPLTVTVVNAAEEPLAIIDGPDHQPFRIVLEESVAVSPDNAVRLKNEPAPADTFDPSALRVLNPGEAYQFTLDLSDPAYQLSRGETPVSWTDTRSFNRARIVYEMPETARILGSLPAGVRLWQGRLASRAFWGWQFVD